jgi:tripartite-type tricarboxylate transporter receptor subunit TctC
MNRRQILFGSLAASAAGALPTTAQEQFPQRPIVLANGYPPGGSTDVAARLLADAAAGHLGARRASNTILRVSRPELLH